MTTRAFFAHHRRATDVLSFFLTLLLLLPSLAAFAQPPLQTARLVKPHASPKPTDKPVEQLKVGDVIPARSNATGKVEWKQVIHASRRTVQSLLSVQLTNAKTGKPVETLTCPLDQPVTLPGGKSVPAGRLSVGNCIVTRAGPVSKVKALFLLRKPGGFVLSDVRAAVCGKGETACSVTGWTGAKQCSLYELQNPCVESVLCRSCQHKQQSIQPLLISRPAI